MSFFISNTHCFIMINKTKYLKGSSLVLVLQWFWVTRNRLVNFYLVTHLNQYYARPSRASKTTRLTSYTEWPTLTLLCWNQQPLNSTSCYHFTFLFERSHTYPLKPLCTTYLSRELVHRPFLNYKSILFLISSNYLKESDIKHIEATLNMFHDNILLFYLFAYEMLTVIV